jgi:Cu/Ag efflux protein CusF
MAHCLVRFSRTEQREDRMKNGWGWMAGIGAAGLLVAGAPAYAGGEKAGSAGSTAGTQSETDTTLGGTGASGSMGSTGSAESTPGTAGTTDPSTGSMGSSATGAAEPHGSMGAMSQNEVTGKVDKFDQSSNELTLSLKVSDSTQVKKDGQTASLSDIKEGDQVRASFTGSGESLQVTEIEVMSSGAGSTGISSDPGTSGSTGTSADPDKAKTGLETPPSSGSTGSSPGGSSTSGSSGSRGY